MVLPFSQYEMVSVVAKALPIKNKTSIVIDWQLSPHSKNVLQQFLNYF